MITEGSSHKHLQRKWNQLVCSNAYFVQAGDLRCKSSHSISCPVICYQYMSNSSSLSKRLLPTLHVSREPRRCFPTQDSNLALLLNSENEKLRSCQVDINLNSCSQCSSFSDLLSLISISAMFSNSMLWTTEWLELLFPVLLGFLCKSEMADETQANEHLLPGFLEFAYLKHFEEGCW